MSPRVCERSPRLAHVPANPRIRRFPCIVSVSPYGLILASGSFVGNTAPLCRRSISGTSPGARNSAFPRSPRADPAPLIQSGRQDHRIGRRGVSDPDLGCRHRAGDVPPLGPPLGDLVLAISPAYRTLYTGSADRTIRRWDPVSGRDLGFFARSTSRPRTWRSRPWQGFARLPVQGRRDLERGRAAEIRRLHITTSCPCPLSRLLSRRQDRVSRKAGSGTLSSGEPSMTLRAHRYGPPPGTLAYGLSQKLQSGQTPSSRSRAGQARETDPRP